MNVYKLKIRFIDFPFEQFQNIRFYNEEYVQEVYENAKKMGSKAIDALLEVFYIKDEIMRINGTMMVVSPDCAPNSFGFGYYRKNEFYSIEGRPYLVGGIIYSGPGVPLNGFAPTFTVGIYDTPADEHRWSTHT